ncbi:MAG: glycosyltransferase [Chloroflexi bacterium]|nr:glycosyltransferase [Chloroflexota bacterium]
MFASRSLCANDHLLKHILFVTDVDITSENGYRTRVLSEAREVSRNGARISFMSFVFARALTKNSRGAAEFIAKAEGLGAKIWLLPSPPHFKRAALIRMVDRYKTGLLRIAILGLRPDIVQGEGTTAAYTAVAIDRKNRPPVVFDMHGAIPEEIQASELPEAYRKMQLTRVEHMEEIALARSQYVISVSDALVGHWQRKYPTIRTRVEIIPCAVNTDLFRLDDLSRRTRRLEWELGDEDPLFVYSGAAQAYQQVDRVARVFARVLTLLPSAKILFLVPSRDREQVEALIHANQIPKTRCVVQSAIHHEVPSYLSAADVGFLLRDNLLLNRVASPTKFGEYMACGVPIIGSPNVESVKEAILHQEIGFLLDSDNPESLGVLVSCVRNLMRQRYSWARKCRTYAEQSLSWNRFGKELVKLYSNL